MMNNSSEKPVVSIWPYKKPSDKLLCLLLQNRYESREGIWVMERKRKHEQVFHLSIWRAVFRTSISDISCFEWLSLRQADFLQVSEHITPYENATRLLSSDLCSSVSQLYVRERRKED